MRERQMNTQAVSEDEQVDKEPRLDGWTFGDLIENIEDKPPDLQIESGDGLILQRKPVLYTKSVQKTLLHYLSVNFFGSE